MVPIQWRKQIIKLYHQLAHSGQKDTVKKVSSSYYWPGLRKDVSNYVTRCQDCQAVKAFKTIRPVRGNIPVPDQRFSHLQVDIVGPLPPSEGHRYLLTILDRTSRWIEALPLIEATSESCATAFIRGWLKTFGLPRVVTSDNGNTFVAQLWKGLHKALGIEVAYPPPHIIPAHWGV